MNREELLTQKGKEIQEILEQWVQELSLLGLGEQVVFSMKIERVPLVAQEEIVDALLDLSLPRFFTKERCAKISNAHKSLPQRIRFQLHLYARIGTVRELLGMPRSEIRRLRNVGDITLQRIEEVLALEGFNLSD